MNYTGSRWCLLIDLLNYSYPGIKYSAYMSFVCTQDMCLFSLYASFVAIYLWILCTLPPTKRAVLMKITKCLSGILKYYFLVYWNTTFWYTEILLSSTLKYYFWYTEIQLSGILKYTLWYTEILLIMVPSKYSTLWLSWYYWD